MKRIRHYRIVLSCMVAVFWFIVFSTMPFLLEARELTEGDVHAAVLTWVRKVTAQARPDAAIERMEPYSADGEIYGYIAHLASGGFCLCGVDDLVLPVYYYCAEGSYDPQIPDYGDILEEIRTRTLFLRQGLREGHVDVIRYQQALTERAIFWRELMAGRSPEKKIQEDHRAEPTSMELPLTSTWRQGSPYNDRCPELTPAADERCVVGCVATAMSQVMYYWRWPNTGTGTGSTTYHYRWRNSWDEEPLGTNPGIPVDPDWVGRLEWTAAGGGKLRMNGYWDQTLYDKAWDISESVSYRNAFQALWNDLTNASTNCNANFGATTYDWSLMEDNHTDPPDVGDNEVAELCYHAGIAVEMDYGLKGSGAYSDNVETALQDHFRYDSDADYQSKDTDKMTEDIQWLRVFHFRGQGHAWVVLGYNKATDPDRQFLMNMGWGGAPGWYTCDNVPGGYTIDQRHTLRIVPEQGIKFVGDDDPGDGSPSDPYEDIDEAVAEAPDYTTLIFRAGSDNGFSGPSLVIDRPMTLRGYNAVIRRTPFIQGGLSPGHHPAQDSRP